MIAFISKMRGLSLKDKSYGSELITLITAARKSTNTTFNCSLVAYGSLVLWHLLQRLTSDQFYLILLVATLQYLYLAKKNLLFQNYHF